MDSVNWEVDWSDRANLVLLACMPRVLAAVRVAQLLGPFERDPAYRGLAEGLRVLVADGRVPVGTRLPSERALTDALKVSRTTVARAYAELRDHGYLVSRRGSGSVAALPAGPGQRGDHLLPLGMAVGDAIDLTIAAPLPGPGVLAAYQRAIAELPAHLSGTGYSPSGLPVLRAAVAAAYEARGLPTSPDQILVVPGSLAGVAVAVRTLLRHGDRVVLESPTYPNAIATLGLAGARLIGVDVPPDAAECGADAEGLAVSIEQVAPQVAYLIPDFHNPTAALLDDAQRSRVARALRRRGTVAIVDESMVMLPLDGQPMPQPFAVHSPAAWSVGSLSKVFWGGLRIGWIRVPERSVDAAFRARLSLDLGSALLEQLVGADLLVNGDALLAHRREQLRTSRDAALTAIREHLPEWDVPRPGGGLSLWCQLPAPLSSSLVPHAARHGVLIAAGPAFAPEGGLDRYLRLPYAGPSALLVEAIARLRTAWQETLIAPGRLTAARVPNLVA